MEIDENGVFAFDTDDLMEGFIPAIQMVQAAMREKKLFVTHLPVEEDQLSDLLFFIMGMQYGYVGKLTEEMENKPGKLN